MSNIKSKAKAFMRETVLSKEKVVPRREEMFIKLDSAALYQIPKELQKSGGSGVEGKKRKSPGRRKYLVYYGSERNENLFFRCGQHGFCKINYGRLYFDT